MIKIKDRMINQLLSKVYVDKKDLSLIRVDIDNVATILSNHGYNLPHKQFESNVEHLLNRKLIGAKVTEGLKYAIVNLIVDLADKMHVDDKEIMDYILTHDKEEDVRELQEKIKNWRKEHYGSMGKSEKNALLDSLQGKLRPDVLDEIRRA